MAGGITTCVAYMVSFFILKLYPFMKISLETYGVFYFYGAMAFLGTIFIYIFLPETEGKTLQEIEQWFSSKGKQFHCYCDLQYVNNLKTKVYHCYICYKKNK